MTTKNLSVEMWVDGSGNETSVQGLTIGQDKWARIETEEMSNRSILDNFVSAHC